MAPRRARDVIRHPITQNVFGLYVLQLGTFAVPLITLPYIVRVLHPAEFGLVVFSQGFSFFLALCIDWGFTPDGVRQVAASRDDPAALSDVVRRVLGAQVLLAAASAPITLALLFAVPKFAAHPLYLLFAWIAAAANGLAPNWFFMGIEKLRLSSLISLAFRVLGAGLTFAFVNGPGQAWIVLALFAGSALAALLSLSVRMFRYVRVSIPRLTESWAAIRHASTLFVATVAVSLYVAVNVVLVGLFEPAAVVAHYGAAERVVRVSLTVLGPIGTAVYPRLAFLQASRHHDRARQLLGVTAALMALGGVLLAAILAVFAPLIIHIIFGSEFVSPSVPILRVLVGVIPLSIVGGITGSWLITLHMDRRATIIVLRAGLLNVALACVLTPLFGAIGTASSVVCAEAVATGGTVLAVLGTQREPAVRLLARTAEKALQDMGIEYERFPGPSPSRSKRTALIEGTGQALYPASRP
jgi:polysaccharide transporter, PST family